jgi:pimeloyl-ACP methyl ester carboxylesterase
MLWGFPVLLGTVAPEALRHRIGKRFRMPLLEDKRAARLLLAGQFNHPPRIPRLLPFTDDELRAIEVPISVLVGQQTEVFDPDEIVTRAQSLIPQIDVGLVPGAGHAFPVDHVDLVLSHLEAITARSE